MWTSTLELTPGRVLATKLLGRFWRGAYFSSFAPFQVQNLPRQPLPDPKWVRVRNTLAGVCGSDLHLIFAGRAFNTAAAALPSRSPIYLGHEAVGEVIEVGDEVQRLHAGERVVLQYGPNCVTADAQPVCRSCAVGNYSLCEYGAFHGMQPIGGGWSEEMLLHEQQLFRVPDELTDAQAVLLEPSAVAIHAVLRHLPGAGDKVLIIGAGTVGLLVLQVIRALAPEAEVHVLARHTFQVERATRLGAAQIIYPRDRYEEIQLATSAQLYQGSWGNKTLLGGYDVIYDTAGSQQTIYDALRWAQAGATVVIVGLNLHRMKLDLTPLWYQEINLIGSSDHGTENWPLGTNQRTSTFEIATDMIRQGQLHPEKLITHSYPLNDYRGALLTATDKARNHAIKVIFDYSKQPPSVVPNVRASARSRPRLLTAELEPHLSQPLNPRDVEEYQGIVSFGKRELSPTPAQARSVPAADTNDVENEDDMKTVVVRPSKPGRFGSRPPATEVPSASSTDSDIHNQVDDNETRTSSKRTRFGVTSYYGSLASFHQRVEKPGNPEESSAGEEDETTKTFAVTAPPSTPADAVESVSGEVQVDTPAQAGPAGIEYFEENAGDNYAWAQLIAPVDSSQENSERSEDVEREDGTMQTQIVEQGPDVDVMTAPVSLNEGDIETGQKPEAEPALTQSIEEPPGSTASTEEARDTVTVTPNKRGRSKRKTANIRNGSN